MLIHSTHMSGGRVMIDMMSLSARPLNPYVTLWRVSERSWWHNCDQSSKTFTYSTDSAVMMIQTSVHPYINSHIEATEERRLSWSRHCLRLKARRCHAEIPSTCTLHAGSSRWRHFRNWVRIHWTFPKSRLLYTFLLFERGFSLVLRPTFREHIAQITSPRMPERKGFSYKRCSLKLLRVNLEPFHCSPLGENIVRFLNSSGRSR